MKRARELLARLLKRYVVHWYVVTAGLYLLMIPLSILVFPKTTILVTIVVLFSGFTSAVAALSSVLVDAEQDDEIDDLEDDDASG